MTYNSRSIQKMNSQLELIKAFYKCFYIISKRYIPSFSPEKERSAFKYRGPFSNPFAAKGLNKFNFGRAGRYELILDSPDGMTSRKKFSFRMKWNVHVNINREIKYQIL